MLFLLNFRFYILKIISYKKHISGYKLSLKNSILDFCPYWNSFENSKLWFWDFPIPKSPNGYLSQSFTLWMSTGTRNCQGCFLLWVPSMVILVFLTGWLQANILTFPEVFSRGRGILCCLSCFREGDWKTPVRLMASRTVSHVPRMSEGAWDRTSRRCLPDSAASLLMRSHLPGEPRVWWLFGPRASRLVDSTLFMPPQRGGTPGLLHLFT